MPGKLGLGLYQNDQGLADDVARSGANACLIFNTALAQSQHIRDLNPGILLIGRRYLTDGEQSYYLNLPAEQQYSECYNFGASLVQDHPAIDVWQFLNEVYAYPQWDVLQSQVAAEKAFTDGCMSQGRTSCVLNIPPGNENVPSEGDFGTFADIIAPLLAHPGVRLWGVHSYGSPDYPQLNAPDADWYALRYRAFVSGLQARGNYVPHLMITEYGQRFGWRWNNFMDQQGCINDFLWFGQRLDEDEIVFGSSNFLHGTENAAMWSDFNTAGTDIMRQVSCWNQGAYPCSVDNRCPDGSLPPCIAPPPGGSLGVVIFALAAAAAFTSAYYITQRST